MTANLNVLDAFINRDSDNAVPEFDRGDRLRKALDHSGLTPADMAEALDVTPTTISRWIRGKSPMRRTHMMLWAIATGVNQAWLETGTADLENQAGRDLYASRDLNPEPADSKVRHLRTVPAGVNRGLTVNRIPGGTRPTPPPDPSQAPERAAARHLRAVS